MVIILALMRGASALHRWMDPYQHFVYFRFIFFLFALCACLLGVSRPKVCHAVCLLLRWIRISDVIEA